nr:hypothetical protein [Tanacetum cinerariifolium]
MVNMVPHEAFACSCAEGDVGIRQSYKPETCASETFWMWIFFMKRDPTSSVDEFSWSFICRTFNTSKLFFRTFNTSKLFFRTFNTSKLFFRTFNTSKLFFRIFKKCRVLKLQALAWKDKCTQGNNELYMHPEQHTVNSAALLHEVLKEIEKLDLE